MLYPIRVGASNQTLSNVTEFYKKAYKNIIEEILTATDFGVYNRKQILNQIEKILQDLGVDIQKFIETEIPKFYKTGADNAVAQLKSAGFNVEVPSGFNRIHKEAVNNLIDDIGQSFAESITGVKRSAEQLLGKAVREMISYKMAEGVTKGSALKEVRNAVKGILQEQGLDSLIDKGGRSWTLDRYSEMLIRTKSVEARNRGFINRVLENGYDLVQVSDHVGECELCRPWEGRILSLTGQTKGYPTLQEAESNGLFHPNCRHAINTIHKDLAERTKAYDSKSGRYV